MKPIFAITVNGQALPAALVDRVFSITVTDSAEQEGDTCEVAFDDRGAALPLPPDMASLEVALGYQGAQLVRQGTYVIDEVELAKGPRSMVWRAMATPVGAAAGAATGPVRGLLNYVYQREGGYNSFNTGVAGDGGEYPGGLTNLTIGQVMDLQGSGKVYAAGAAQFTPPTLPTAMRDAGLSRDDRFSPENQDRMGTALMLGGSRQSLRRYLQGRSDDITAAHQDLCQEWAGVVCPNGRGFYDGDSGGNRAKGSTDEVQALLRSARAEIAAGQAAEQATQTAGGSLGGNQAGNAAPRALVKEKRTQSYHDTTLGEVAGEIAQRHGLQLNLEGEAAGIKIKHEDQTSESDQNFLTRLADKYGLVIKPAEGALHVLPRGSRALSGNLNLRQEEVTRWRARLKDRARFSKAKARWIDRKENKEKVVEVEGSSVGFPAHEVPELHRTEEEAKAAAEAALQGLTSGYVDVNVTMPGTPTVAAQGTITLIDFHPEINSEPWLIKRVTHTFVRSAGFSTTLNCGTPGDEPKRWGEDGASSGQQYGGQADQDVVAFANGTTSVDSYPLTSPMGPRSGRMHYGNDYAIPVGRNLSARQGGKVLFIGNDPGGYGKYMDVRLADGRVARMGHLSRTWIAPGKSFQPNQVLGQTGNTGRSTGPHLHFEDRTGGAPRNPGSLAREFSADP
ncbi:MAG: peptidoglycan DD-metalloendopeptidase family protein [Cyanobacteria bacterium J06638_7]